MPPAVPLVDGSFGDLGIATVTVALLAGAVLGRLHPGSGELGPIGDRVFCGLLAVPWFVLLAHSVFPVAHLAWKLSAPTPILVYTLLLASTEWKLPFATKHFTLSLVVSTAAIYLVAAAVLLLGAA